MMMTIPVAVTICCGISCIVAFNAIGQYDHNAKPLSKQVGGIGPADSPAGVKHDIKYTTSYDLYKKNVLPKLNQESNVVDPQKDEIAKEYKKYIDVIKKELEDNEPKMLEELKLYAKTNKRSGFNSDGELRKYLIASSAISAKIYSTLVREGILEPEIVVYELNVSQMRDSLNSEWLPLLVEMADNKDILISEFAIATLVTSGNRDSLYVDIIKNRALDTKQPKIAVGTSASIIDTIFFGNNITSVKQIPVINNYNMILLDELKNAQDPEVRAICAKYLIVLGNIPEAEQICTEIIWTPYRFTDQTPLYETAYDSRLYRAHTHALYLLYRNIGTETAFSQVYDRAFINSANNEYLPEGFKGYGGYGRERTEISYAKSLLNMK